MMGLLVIVRREMGDGSITLAGMRGWGQKSEGKSRMELAGRFEERSAR